MLHRINLPFLGLFVIAGFIWDYALVRFATIHDVLPMGYAYWQSLEPAMQLSLYILLIRGPVSVPRKAKIFIFLVSIGDLTKWVLSLQKNDIQHLIDYISGTTQPDCKNKDCSDNENYF